jgi:hypothetical protein
MLRPDLSQLGVQLSPLSRRLVSHHKSQAMTLYSTVLSKQRLSWVAATSRHTNLLCTVYTTQNATGPEPVEMEGPGTMRVCCVVLESG